jgi:FkbM family methyltransferase
VPGAIGRIQVRVSTSDVGIFQEIFLDHLYLTPPGISPKFIIDGGANVGFTSIYFAMCFPEAQIIAIEPEYSNFEILSNNVKSYLNIRAINAALWSEKCCISLSNPDDLNCAFRVEPKASGEIETLTLDDLFKLAPDGQIDLLKVDIEGAERELFSKRDMRLNNVSCVMIELHERFAPGCGASFRTAFEGMDFIEHVQGDNIVLSKRKSA